MGIESRNHFGRERLRMPDRQYDDHRIGDRCPLDQRFTFDMEKSWWRRIRYGGIIGGELKKLREYLTLNPGYLDSRADFEVGVPFDPDAYPHGTIVLVGREADIYTTIRTRVRKEQYRSPLRGPSIASTLRPRRPRVEPEWTDLGEWQEREEYDDKTAFRGDNIGVIIKLPNTPHNQTMTVDGDREEIMKGGTRLSFIEGEINPGPWNHLVITTLDPVFVWNPDTKRYLQDDVFHHFTGIKILELGKGVKEEVRRPLGRVSNSIRRALGST